MLRFHNTLSGQKERFEPLDPSCITLYVCGPTVYNYVHIGNARPVVVFDVLYRLLQRLYPAVRYARNITDIDDKIIKAAADAGEGIETLSQRFAQAFDEDMAALGALRPTLVPQATDHIDTMIALIETLVAKGHAYEADGHVLFAVESMADYGALSGRNLDDMLAGARVEVADYKHHAGDFVLWKPSSATQPGWESPWGRGRPGWHIECSAMIEKHLGKTIDLHGGGQDLIFPHHENEIAQGRCAHGTDYVRYWLHNGYINIDGEKMSKSLGNFRLVRELLKEYDGEVLRFAILSSHYRSPLNFSADLLEQSKAGLDSLYQALRGDLEPQPAELPAAHPVLAALADDLGTPQAIRELHALAARINKAETADKPALRGQLRQAATLLGLLQQDAETWFQKAGSEDLSAADIEAYIAERKAARKAKDFARADAIREELEARGVILEDSRDGTRWGRQT